MAISGRPSSRRPLLTSHEEFNLRDELWRCKDEKRKAEIKSLLETIDQVRKTTAKGLQID